MKSFSWISHPAKERRVATVFVILFIHGIFFFVFSVTGSVIMVLIAGLIFLITLSTYFLPTTYTVDEKTVSIKFQFSVKKRNLSAFRMMYPGRRGVLLSPFLAPSRLENFRGFYLRYGKDNKTEVDEFLAELLDEQRQAQAADSRESTGIEAEETDGV
jgi:hypothetical protein